MRAESVIQHKFIMKSLVFHFNVIYNIMVCAAHTVIMARIRVPKTENEMKKLTVLILLIAVIAVCCGLLVACKDDETSDPVAGSYKVKVPSVTAPIGLADYALTIEWLDSDGNPTEFIANRPTVIVFPGVGDYDDKFTTNLDPDVYSTAGVLSSSASNFHLKLSYYWTRNFFNIGVFHYENFADDTYANVNAKIYSASRMTYIKSDGSSVTAAPSFNLTEAFVSAWLKVNSSSLIGSTDKKMMEIRFTGVNVGANLALSCADYLEEMYNAGLIGSEYIPNRVDILNPYFSNVGDSVVVDYREQTTLGSALTYNSTIVEKLAGYGVVMDMVESDEYFYSSYGENYTGIEEQTDGVVWSEEGDSGAYLRIKRNVAYLEFRESFSSKYPTTYVSEAYAADTAVLHWFLYTVNGSDYTSIGAQTYTDQRPVLDGYNMTGVAASTSVKYGVSAWTPTVYLRAMRGVTYEMKRYNSSSSATSKFSDYTMTGFQAESYQVSDLTMEKMYSVCGYIYVSDDENSPFVDLRRDHLLSGVTVTLVAKESNGDGPTRNFTVTTSSDGFYMCNIGRENLGYTVAVSVEKPSNRYATLTTTNENTSNYLNVTRNSIFADSGASVTMNSTDNTNFFVAIYNGGLLKLF